MEQIKFKKLDYVTKDENGNEVTVKSEGVLPTRATVGSAGMDLYSTRITQEVDNSGKPVLVYHTDIAVEIPEGYVGFITMKSSVAKRSVMLCNCLGTIDSDYRGELIAKFKVTTDAVPTIYAQGEAFAQLVIVPCLTLEPTLVEELSSTERGEQGFGEADKNNENE